MRVVSPRAVALCLSLLLFIPTSISAQQDPFRWMSFSDPKDQDIVAWVTKSLAGEKWTAIREIGVEYDAALVITTFRAAPDAAPSADTFSAWSISLTNHGITPLLTGVNLRWLDFMKFTDGGREEPTALYENCTDCAAETYFTAFHYAPREHAWSARWMRGGHAVPLWSTNPPSGVTLSQVYAGLAEPNGREFLVTWTHFDYGKVKPPEDFLFRYDLDPLSVLERTQLLSGKDADVLKHRLCRTQDTLPGLARGQDGPLCDPYAPRPERKPVTTPPANNHGQSVPPGTRPKR